MKFLLSFALSLASLSQSYACIDGKGYLPENNLFISSSHKMLSNVTEAQFNNVLDGVAKIYESEISRAGGNLRINRKWSDGTVNAFARREGSTFVIEMYGGLARHNAITRDGFALVACHEIGHHIGGAPRYTATGNTWASTEGQSDYFATMKCLRKLFQGDDNERIVSQMNIDPRVKKECEEKHSTASDQTICKRVAMAGLSSANLNAALNNGPRPQFSTPDQSRVNQTYEAHPQSQCRLDTYFNGAICDVSENDDFDRNDPNIGACNRRDNDDFGLRPLCWFKPSGITNPEPTPNPTPIPTPNPNPEPTPAPGGIASTPTVNGHTNINISNPNMIVPIQIDVSNFPGATGFAIEVSKPNQRFSNPNGSDVDRQNGLFLQLYQQTRGIYRLNPALQLRVWGSYQIRIIALDKNANPVSRNSNSMILNLNRRLLSYTD